MAPLLPVHKPVLYNHLYYTDRMVCTACGVHRVGWISVVTESERDMIPYHNVSGYSMMEILLCLAEEGAK